MKCAKAPQENLDRGTASAAELSKRMLVASTHQVEPVHVYGRARHYTEIAAQIRNANMVRNRQTGLRTQLICHPSQNNRPIKFPKIPFWEELAPARRNLPE